MLVGLIKKRLLTSTLADWGAAKSMTAAYYEAALGLREPSFGVIFALRERISPELWFYEEGEELPPPVKAAFLHSGAKKAQLKKKILRDETAALEMLREIKEKRELASFSARYKVDYQVLWGVCSRRRKAGGGYGYHQRPPYRIVKALREAVHPALWYIFPEELV